MCLDARSFSRYTFEDMQNGNGNRRGAGKNSRPPKADSKRRSVQRSRRPRRQYPSPGLDFKSLNPLSESAPVALTRVRTTNKPKMITMANGDCRIIHREYVGEIVAGTGTPTPFTVASYPLNPGQVATFQWLSRVAVNYESYAFSALCFEYGTEAPSSLGGTLVLSVDYDASDPAPVSKQQAMAYRSSVRSAPWKECEHSSLPEDLKKSKTNFVRPGAQPPNTDIKTYDIGNLFVATQNATTSAATCGELWVSYDVTLMTPVYENGGGLVPVGGFIGSVGGAGCTPANPFGTNAAVDPTAYGLAVSLASRITFQWPGTYLAVFSVSGTTVTDIPIAGGPGVVASPDLNPTFLASGASGMSVYEIYCPTNNCYVDVTATAAAVTAAAVWIAAAPPNSLA